MIEKKQKNIRKSISQKTKQGKENPFIMKRVSVTPEKLEEVNYSDLDRFNISESQQPSNYSLPDDNLSEINKIFELNDNRIQSINKKRKPDTIFD